VDVLIQYSRQTQKDLQHFRQEIRGIDEDPWIISLLIPSFMMEDIGFRTAQDMFDAFAVHSADFRYAGAALRKKLDAFINEHSVFADWQ